MGTLEKWIRGADGLADWLKSFVDLPFGVDLFFTTLGVHVVELALVVNARLARVHHRMVQRIGDRRGHCVAQWKACVYLRHQACSSELSGMGVDVTGHIRSWGGCVLMMTALCVGVEPAALVTGLVLHFVSFP